MISIIMSTYNSADTLPKAIDSILSQTFKDFEFLIMDDGSTDNTQQILENYLEIDNRVKIFKNRQNIGLTKSLNLLAERSNYEILARQDSDDISHNQRLEKQYSLLMSTDFSICTTRAKSMQTLKKIPRFTFYFPKKMLLKYKNPFVHGTLMINKKTFMEIGGYNVDYEYAQDYKLMLDLYRAGSKVKILKQVLYYLNTENNISTLKATEQRYYFKKAQIKSN